MSERTQEQIAATIASERRRIEDARKGHAESVAWVENNVPVETRCEACGGVGLEEMDQGRYQHCQACKGTGRKEA
jgi:DnaJ-class molecular chaperone